MTKIIQSICGVIACLFVGFAFFPSKALTCAGGESYTAGKAECVMELDTGRILYESQGDIRLPMASTTKIVTAATVLSLCDNLKEELTIPPEAAGVEGSSVYLKSGDIYTVEELLYGLMLRSGNDCAVALALRFGGSIGGFASKMNETAQKAGALHSRFSNPHGLPSENHYTTARDLSYITRYAMHNTVFREIVSTKYYEPRHWQNKNKMLTEYDGGIGVKTGYTKEAGRCLVSAAKRGNMTLVCTVLSCQPMYERSAELLDDAFKSFENKLLLKEGTPLLIDNGSEQIKGAPKEDFYYPLSEGEESQLEIKTFPYTTMKNKEIVGQFEIYLSKRLLFSGNLYKL